MLKKQLGMKDKSVSVCMAIHNGADFLSYQLDSIFSQLGEEDELIIADDDSTDGTEKILSQYSDKRMRILPKGKFHDPTKNFGYALGECKNEIIFLADQDDVWHPRKIEIMKQELTDCELVVCDCSLVDKKLTEMVPSFFAYNKSKNGVISNLVKNSFIGCCMAFHRQVLERALPFPPSIPAHDQWVGLVALKYFNVKFIPQTLVLHRRHGKNFSTTGHASRNSIGKKLISRFRLAKELTAR
jgi:glycosyltransferase involved in cell wall biosynthesis